MVLHGFAVTQDAAFAAAHAVLGDARLFVEQADGAAVRGIGIRIAGIPILVPLPGVIDQSVLVEGVRLFAGERCEVQPARAAGICGLMGGRGGEKRWVSWAPMPCASTNKLGVPCGNFADAAAGFRDGRRGSSRG
jgi:hypothetical protein